MDNNLQSLPQTYKVVQQEKWGIENLQYIELPLDPILGDNEVLVKVTASQITEYNIKIETTGRKDFPLPHQPGYEAVGTIVRVGEKVEKKFLNKNTVFRISKFSGGWAEYAKTNLNDCVIFEENEYDHENALAAALVNPQTAYGVYKRMMEYKPQVVVNTAAGSCIARYIFRMVQTFHKDVKMINVIRNEKKIEELKQSEKTEDVVSTDKEGYLEKIKEFCGDSKTVLLDCLCCETSQDIFKILPNNSVLYCYGGMAGKGFNLDLVHVVLTEKQIGGYCYTKWYKEQNQDQIKEMNDFIKENYTTVFATKVDKIIKFEDFLQGMKDWEEGNLKAGGRIVLQP